MGRFVNPYPWYDSPWLAAYSYASELIRQLHPHRLAEFEERLAPLRTTPEFRTARFEQVFDDETLARLRSVVEGLEADQVEQHEQLRFGRFVVHDHPLVMQLQHDVVDLVSEAAGERVEPCYSFVSLYRSGGVCEVHMDAPEAKWTLDLCVRQSTPWPIHISQVVDWPEHTFVPPGEDWEGVIKDDPALQFEPFALEPGQALLFSGSSQWHYRDPQPGPPETAFCDLVFFHFVPAGMAELVYPHSWARAFGLPELAMLRATPRTDLTPA